MRHASSTSSWIAPAQRKQTKAEALAEGIGATAGKIDDIDFPSFTAEDRTMLIESMNALKEILDRPSPGRWRTRKNRTENESASRKSSNKVV